MNIVRIEVTADYETAERAGAAPLFQVVDLIGYFENDNQVNLVRFIDQVYFYKNENQVLKDIVKKCNEYTFENCDIEIAG